MISLRLNASWFPGVALIAAVLLALLAIWLYRRETRRAALGAVGWLLPILRGLAILIVTLTLAEPILETRSREGELSQLTILLDSSRSMTISDTETPQSRSRFARASEILRSRGLLESLQYQFEILVSRIGEEPLHDLWRSNFDYSSESVPGESWEPELWSEITPLGAALQQAAARMVGGDKPTKSNLEGTIGAAASILLLSDGQSNFGQSPVAVANELKRLGVAVFAVGLGPFVEPADLGLRDVSFPLQVNREDSLQGSFTIVERDSAGRPFSLQIEHDSKVIWQQAFTATHNPQRQIEFSLPVLPLYEQALEEQRGQADYAALPIKLTARLIVQGGEKNEENNVRDFYFNIVSQEYRVLLLDGRSRWESRYLKNIFSRDPAWHIESLLRSTSDSHSQQSLLPQSKEALFHYDLIILGDVDAESLSPELLDWIREFVEVAGGGLIFLDGARQHLRQGQYANLHRLSPVRWIEKQAPSGSSVRDEIPKTASLTTAGKALEALRLVPLAPQFSHPTQQTQADTSAQLWSELPPVQYVSRVEALPGSEVLVEVSNQVDRFPLLTWRRYGAGRVLFLASDETWRWRYKVADTVHSRLWVQLARWLMKPPMSVRGEFVSLDTGAASVNAGQPVQVRCQLREADGQPASQRTVAAVVTGADHMPTRFPMIEDAVPGNYVTYLDSLPAGEYQVQVSAAGFSQQSLDLRASFTVLGPSGNEMQQVACDEALLRAVAIETGGQYFRESQAEQILEVLQPRSQGRIRHSATIVWQSYWWFSAAILLLIVEWLVRKNAGLV